ncbi:hypothetical protein GQ600_10933 [Phytophthora cactorum]|nr:hypothetical protein GQ600_10933 [Phytophthora cactorum]
MGDINTQKFVNVNSDTDTSTDMDVDDEGKTSETANTPRSRARRKVRRKTRANDAPRARNLKAAHNGYENVTNPNGTLQPAIT